MSNVEFEVPEEEAPASDSPASSSATTRLDLTVEITDSGPCSKHLKVAISRADIERQFRESLQNMRKEAFVPGFRPGKAPVQLVEARYRREVASQVKGQLLMACVEQLDQDYKLNPLSTPNLDVEAIVLPKTGPMVFEIDLEVPPDFDLPNYKSLKIERPVKEITDSDVDARISAMLEEQQGVIAPKTSGAVELNDFVVANLTFTLPDQTQVVHKEVQFRVREELVLNDAVIKNINESLVGAKSDDTRQASCEMSAHCANESLRGVTISVKIEILDLKYYRVPEITHEFVEMLGFSNIGDYRQEAYDQVARQIEHQQFEAVRKSVLDQILDQCKFDLPAEVVERQAGTIISRRVQELQNAGFAADQIRLAEKELQQDAQISARRALSEYFLLSRIANSEGLVVNEEDYDEEIDRIAKVSGESTRRVRARLEKDNQLEGLASQILERKALNHILSEAEIADVPMPHQASVDVIDLTIIKLDDSSASS